MLGGLEIKTGKNLMECAELGMAPANAVWFSPDQKRLTLAGDWGIHEISFTGTQEPTGKTFTSDGVSYFAPCPESAHPWIGARGLDIVRIDANGGQKEAWGEDSEQRDSVVSILGVSPDGTALATARRSGAIAEPGPAMGVRLVSSTASSSRAH